MIIVLEVKVWLGDTGHPLKPYGPQIEPLYLQDTLY